jgi:hypothetical protein
MGWVTSRIKWIMIVAGVLTCTMVYAALSPQAALASIFGESLQGPVADMYGAQYLSRAGLAVAVDAVMICLFAICLPGNARRP